MVKKNDICVIERARSYTRANGPTVRYAEFLFARVNTAARDGTIKSVIAGGTGFGTVLDIKRDVTRVYTIDKPETQALARRAAEANPHATFEDMGDIKQAILSA